MVHVPLEEYIKTLKAVEDAEVGVCPQTVSLVTWLAI